MPSCVFRRCTNYTGTINKMQDVSFHLLPKTGLVREKWISVIRRQRREEDWIPSSYSTICSEHFLPHDIYMTKKNTRRIKKSAVPVIEHEEKHCLSTPASLDVVNISERNVSSPTSLDLVYISDEDSIFDTPRNAYLKSTIEKLSASKRRLQINNYNLAKRNKRLKKKCDNLQKIVTQLRKKILFYTRSATQTDSKSCGTDP